MIQRVVHITLAVSALALASQAHALVESGHWRSSYGNTGPLGNNFDVAVDQTVAGDYTGVFMNYSQGVLKGITYNVDEGADIFVVKPGTVFSNASIALGQPPFIQGPSSYQVLPTSTVTVGNDFYLGVRTRSGSDAGFSEAVSAGQLSSFFTSFGWAHFKTDATGAVKLIDSAMAFREGGIVVGALQAVPEPSTFFLGAVGCVGVACAARTRRKAD